MGLDVLRCKKQVQEEKGRDGKHMKNLRRLAGITVSLIVVFMVIALFRYQADEEIALLPDQIEYLFNEDWEVAVLEAAQMSGPELESHEKIKALFADAQRLEKAGRQGFPMRERAVRLTR